MYKLLALALLACTAAATPQDVPVTNLPGTSTFTSLPGSSTDYTPTVNPTSLPSNSPTPSTTLPIGSGTPPWWAPSPSSSPPIKSSSTLTPSLPTGSANPTTTPTGVEDPTFTGAASALHAHGTFYAVAGILVGAVMV